MELIAGMKPTGRQLRGPASDLVELDGANGLRHTAIHFHPEYRDHNAINDALAVVRDFLASPMVTGMIELVEADADAGAYVYPTGKCWSVAEVIRILADSGHTGGTRAGLELMFAAGQILVEGADTGEAEGVYSHGGLTPWRVMLRQDGQILIIGYALPQVEILEFHADPNQVPREDSFRYCPPERMEAAAEDISSDLFGLALIAFELMTGKPVYDGLVDDIRQQAARGEGSRRLFRFRDKLTPGVRELLATALKPAVEHRYPSGNDFLDGVKAALRSPDATGPSLMDLMATVANQATRVGAKPESASTMMGTADDFRALLDDGEEEGEDEAAGGGAKAWAPPPDRSRRRRAPARTVDPEPEEEVAPEPAAPPPRAAKPAAEKPAEPRKARSPRRARRAPASGEQSLMDSLRASMASSQPIGGDGTEAEAEAPEATPGRAPRVGKVRRPVRSRKPEPEAATLPPPPAASPADAGPRLPRRANRSAPRPPVVPDVAPAEPAASATPAKARPRSAPSASDLLRRIRTSGSEAILADAPPAPPIPPAAVPDDAMQADTVAPPRPRFVRGAGAASSPPASPKPRRGSLPVTTGAAPSDGVGPTPPPTPPMEAAPSGDAPKIMPPMAPRRRGRSRPPEEEVSVSLPMPEETAAPAVSGAPADPGPAADQATAQLPTPAAGRTPTPPPSPSKSRGKASSAKGATGKSRAKKPPKAPSPKSPPPKAPSPKSPPPKSPPPSSSKAPVPTTAPTAADADAGSVPRAVAPAVPAAAAGVAGATEFSGAADLSRPPDPIKVTAGGKTPHSLTLRRGGTGRTLKVKVPKGQTLAEVIANLICSRLPVHTDLTGAVTGWYRLELDGERLAPESTVGSVEAGRELNIAFVPNRVMTADINVVGGPVPMRFVAPVGTAVPVCSLVDHLCAWLALPAGAWALSTGGVDLAPQLILSDLDLPENGLLSLRLARPESAR